MLRGTETCLCVHSPTALYRCSAWFPNSHSGTQLLPVLPPQQSVKWAGTAARLHSWLARAPLAIAVGSAASTVCRLLSPAHLVANLYCIEGGLCFSTLNLHPILLTKVLILSHVGEKGGDGVCGPLNPAGLLWWLQGWRSVFPSALRNFGTICIYLFILLTCEITLFTSTSAE